MTRLFTLPVLLVALSAECQTPPTVQPITWYASAFAYDGTNISNSGSPEVSWQGQATWDVWPYNYSNRFCVLIGKRSHSYLYMVDAGTNRSITWPPIMPTPVWDFYFGGKFVTSSTNLPAAALLKAFDGQSNFVNIGLSTNCVTFEPFGIFQPADGATWSVNRVQ